MYSVVMSTYPLFVESYDRGVDWDVEQLTIERLRTVKTTFITLLTDNYFRSTDYG